MSQLSMSLPIHTFSSLHLFSQSWPKGTFLLRERSPQRQHGRPPPSNENHVLAPEVGSNQQHTCLLSLPPRLSREHPLTYPSPLLPDYSRSCHRIRRDLAQCRPRSAAAQSPAHS